MNYYFQPDYFLNFFRPYPASPASPEPKSKIVAGSGTGEAPEEPPDPGFVSTTLVDTKLELLELLELCSLQAETPKIINTTHKNTNNFFMLIPPLTNLSTPKISFPFY